MTRTDIAKELRRFTGKGLVTATELSRFIGDKNLHRVKVKYLVGLERIGRGYLITDVADRLKEGAEYVFDETVS